ncbi:CHAP domain-containing protein [Cellulophaga sp. E6(2014)]|uniref:CHAP domain-containing protein n=1 Tax=Cellulophaga sp. E6(2014) TaxID=1495334 RepID=UPI00051D5E61|nr:CHAP domain-containing protein [Cellulophaga sp. E6(2014)]KGK30931.1 amidase [Cellulophaga sp. E6(2014)]
MKKRSVLILGILILFTVGFFVSKKINLNSNFEVGQKIDDLNGVVVYYNGGVGNVAGREVTEDGYNLGLKYQCVEFVKRYYYQALNHKMPDSYGNGKDFFSKTLDDGGLNIKRNLNQFTNPSSSKPKVNDLVVYSGTLFNKYGHVAIISKVTEREVEIIQQNPGPFGESRETYDLIREEDKWLIDHSRIMGWLRK